LLINTLQNFALIKKGSHGRRISGIFLPVAIFREEKFRENKEVDSTTNRAAATLGVWRTLAERRRTHPEV